MSAHLAWALFAAVLLATNCATHVRLENAQIVNKTMKRELATQKEAAATILAAEIAKKEAAEKALQAFKDQQEKTDATNKATVDALAKKLLATGDAAGRLRDPNAAGCGRGGGGATGPVAGPARGGGENTPEAGGLLSVQLSELLRQRLRDAEDINTAYASCRADTMKLRGITKGTEN